MLCLVRSRGCCLCCRACAQVIGAGQVRSLQLSAKWDLVASLSRDNTGPDWPVLEYGVSFDSEVSKEEANEVSFETENTLEEVSATEGTVGASVGVEMGVGMDVGVASASVSTSFEMEVHIPYRTLVPHARS